MSNEQEQSAEVRELHATIDFGFQAEAFVLSDLGKFLIGRAEAEIAEAVEELKAVNPFSTDEIRTLQNKIWRAESVQSWLAEAIQAGASSQAEYMNRGDSA